MKKIESIRSKHRNGSKIKELVRTEGVCRNSVRKYIRQESLNDVSVKERAVTYPKLSEHIEEIHRILYEDKDARRKRSYKFIYGHIKRQGYTGSYMSVCRYIKKVRGDIVGESFSKGFIPLSFEVGEAYQFDWSEQYIIISGKTVKIQVAHFQLCNSRYRFVVAYPNQKQEMLQDAHIKAFDFFQGVTRYGIYDNPKTVVTKLLRGKDREWNPAFSQLMAHYRTTAKACNPASGWEKGRVERQVQTDEDQFFTPIPSVNNLDEFNEQLLSGVITYNKSTYHPEHRDRTIEDVYLNDELPYLSKPPTRFEYSIERNVRVSKTCLVTYDNNKYSVCCSVVGKLIQLKISADRLVMVYKGNEVGSYKRSFARHKIFYNFIHYINILVRKPGALRNGAPFKDMALPENLKRAEKYLLSNDRDKEFVEVLSYLMSYSIEEVDIACKAAFDAGVISPEFILNRLQAEPEEEIEIELPRYLAISCIPSDDCSEYNNLLTQV